MEARHSAWLAYCYHHNLFQSYIYRRRGLVEEASALLSSLSGERQPPCTTIFSFCCVFNSCMFISLFLDLFGI